MMTWLSYLGDLHTQVIDMGLERVGAVADIMNLRYPAPKVITVPGPTAKAPPAIRSNLSCWLQGCGSGYTAPRIW